jgi:hypothetical protein
MRRVIRFVPEKTSEAEERQIKYFSTSFLPLSSTKGLCQLSVRPYPQLRIAALPFKMPAFGIHGANLGHDKTAKRILPRLLFLVNFH